MISLNLPNFDIKLRQQDNGQTEIFDFLRQRYIRLTPEEWVRQHFTHFLVEHKHYPAGLLGNEVSLNVNGVERRCDSVLFNREGGNPRMIIEYKAPSIRITQKVFTQINSYNSVLHADYLIVSNGLDHYICRINYSDLSILFLPEIPDYTELQ
ncbi:type I restriction enzyme HsdR N-terminal domain-containing protein [Alloprevotella rava]|uniref:Type I restriction enzyme R protein N-terminal domain-containing protein n=1 Tax=Alloprevotella rava TaxID=671218 RepID=A0A7W5UIL8_9BACT|nr:type I restriction enzyme HsdR N-terminal domain-containing protein [Alloprevotella rava]MBB3702555.1 hypothetical protein [Alloprevotella rava]